MSRPERQERKGAEERLKQEVERLRRELAERERQIAEQAKRIADLLRVCIPACMPSLRSLRIECFSVPAVIGGSQMYGWTGMASDLSALIQVRARTSWKT